MSYIYNGNIIIPNVVMFDPISQMYSLAIDEFAYFDSWRRDSGRYGIKQRSVKIYISQQTPHIISLKENKLSESDICREIFNLSYNYVDYAITGSNIKWITYTTSESTWVGDRLDIGDIHKDIQTKCIQNVDLVGIRNTY